MTSATDVERVGLCRPSCCKTPHGHATGRDQFAPTDSRACHCHDVKPAPMKPRVTIEELLYGVSE